MFIYKITNTINDKIYIGQTSGPIELRWRRHGYSSSGQNMPIAKAIRKYGKDKFSIEPIISVLKHEHMNDLEDLMMQLYRSLDIKLYNAKKAGGKGCLTTEETRKKLSEHGKTLTGAKNPFFGKKHTDEALKIITTCWMKRTEEYERTAEHRAITSKTHKGKVPSFEMRLKLSKRIRCLNFNEEYYSMGYASSVLGISVSSIMDVLKGKYKDSYGLRFEYVK